MTILWNIERNYKKMVEYMEYKTMFKSMYNRVKGWLNYHKIYYVSDKIGSYYYFNIYIDTAISNGLINFINNKCIINKGC